MWDSSDGARGRSKPREDSVVLAVEHVTEGLGEHVGRQVGGGAGAESKSSSDDLVLGPWSTIWPGKAATRRSMCPARP